MNGLRLVETYGSESERITSETIMYIFTEHARERWEERIGGALPSNLEIEGIIEESVVLQKFRLAYTPRGMPLGFLAVYWNVQRGIALKVDERCGKVVTVLGPNGRAYKIK